MKNLLSSMLLLLAVFSCGRCSNVKSEKTLGTNAPTENKPGDDGEPTGTQYPENVTLHFQWDTPQQREDCSALNLAEIGGYNFYIGFQENIWEPAMDINDGSATAYNIALQSDGTYYFAIETYTTDHVSSKKSPTIKVICKEAKCSFDIPAGEAPSCSLSSSSEGSISINGSSSPKLAQKELCPNFKLQDPKKYNPIYYYGANLRVTPSANGHKIIQCNWKQFYNEEDKKQHKVGIQNLNLHLPIFQSANAFLFDVLLQLKQEDSYGAIAL